jgi:hypothetical protein
MGDTPTVLGVPLDTNHVLAAIGGGAALVALGPAVLALPVIADVAAMTGVTMGPGALAAIGGYLAAKNLTNPADTTVATVK